MNIKIICTLVFVCFAQSEASFFKDLGKSLLTKILQNTDGGLKTGFDSVTKSNLKARGTASGDIQGKGKGKADVGLTFGQGGPGLSAQARGQGQVLGEGALNGEVEGEIENQSVFRASGGTTTSIGNNPFDVADSQNFLNSGSAWQPISFSSDRPYVQPSYYRPNNYY
ncbi:hypothetical protein SNEBB_010275 [Seison nebaliae]|nr:hypothetical protein SNEBB_010275 [Seison nebaliae]